MVSAETLIEVFSTTILNNINVVNNIDIIFFINTSYNSLVTYFTNSLTEYSETKIPIKAIVSPIAIPNTGILKNHKVYSKIGIIKFLNLVKPSTTKLIVFVIGDSKAIKN